MKKETVRTAIHIGATKQAVESITKNILSILKVDKSDAVLLKALDVFNQAAQVRDACISNCNFHMKT